MYQVKNISGGQLVCTLADKVTTFRVDNKKTEPVSDDQMTQHLFNLEKKKLVKITHTEDAPTTKTNAAPAAEKEG